MTCQDCGCDTLTDGVCIKCSEKRFYDYPNLKSKLQKIESYVNLLQDGDPENENPKKILDTITDVLENKIKVESN